MQIKLGADLNEIGTDIAWCITIYWWNYTGNTDNKHYNYVDTVKTKTYM